MVINAGFNIYILFTYPDYEAIQRNDAQSDIKDFLASNPAFAAQVMTAGVSVIRSNPGMFYYLFVCYLFIQSEEHQYPFSSRIKLNLSLLRILWKVSLSAICFVTLFYMYNIFID